MCRSREENISNGCREASVYRLDRPIGNPMKKRSLLVIERMKNRHRLFIALTLRRCVAVDVQRQLRPGRVSVAGSIGGGMERRVGHSILGRTPAVAMQQTEQSRCVVGK